MGTDARITRETVDTSLLRLSLLHTSTILIIITITLPTTEPRGLRSNGPLQHRFGDLHRARVPSILTFHPPSPFPPLPKVAAV